MCCGAVGVAGLVDEGVAVLFAVGGVASRMEAGTVVREGRRGGGGWGGS